MNTNFVTADAVEAAARRLDGVVVPTPLEYNARLSAATGAHVWLKREDQQVVRSYKIRGAYNFISQLTEDERAKGVVTASAGNHAQGFALACALLDVRGRIYVPSTTPRQKRDRINTLGKNKAGESMIELIVGGDTYDEAKQASRDFAQQSGSIEVPAFDSPRTIAGQGTLFKEIIDQLDAAPDTVIVPVGGGGLLAGAVSYLGELYPDVRIVGVEPAGAACIGAGLEAGYPVTLENIDPFVDGAAVARAGDTTLPIIAASKAELIAVPEGRVCSEMLTMYQSEGIIAEPAGALAAATLAGSKAPAISITPGETIVCIVSGGNNDVSRYAEIVERALVFEGRKHYFLVNFPQEPGALRRFLDEVLGPDDDITLFEYTKRSNRETGPALVGIELGNPEELPALLERMKLAPAQIEHIEPDSALFRFLL